MDQVRLNIQKWFNSLHKRYSKQWQGMKILEVGCGNLTYNKELFAEGNEYLLTDIVKTEVSEKIINVTSMALNYKSFDMIICSETLEHVYEHKKAFEEMSRVLKEGGFLLITVPWEYPEHGESDYWRYSPKALDRLLEDHDFEIIERSHGRDGDKVTNLFRLARKL